MLENRKRAIVADHADINEAVGIMEELVTKLDDLSIAIHQQHVNYCTADWTDRGLHAPECLLYELDDD